MFWGCKIAIGGLTFPNADALNKGNNFKNTFGMFGTMNEYYIRNSNFYYWK